MNPKKLRLDDQLCFALYAATNAVTRAYRPLLGKLGLTYPQYLVMLVLWQDGPSTVSEIGRRLSLAQNAISPLIDKLEAAGLLLRRRCTQDRRIVQIELTDAGQYLEGETSLVQQSVECRTLLEPDNLAELREDLQSLVRRMEGEELDAVRSAARSRDARQPKDAESRRAER